MKTAITCTPVRYGCTTLDCIHDAEEIRTTPFLPLYYNIMAYYSSTTLECHFLGSSAFLSKIFITPTSGSLYCNNFNTNSTSVHIFWNIRTTTKGISFSGLTLVSSGIVHCKKPEGVSISQTPEDMSKSVTAHILIPNAL